MILTTHPNFNNAVATSCLKYKSTCAIENLQSVGHEFIFQKGREWSLLICFVRCLLGFEPFLTRSQKNMGFKAGFRK